MPSTAAATRQRAVLGGAGSAALAVFSEGTAGVCATMYTNGISDESEMASRCSPCSVDKKSLVDGYDGPFTRCLPLSAATRAPAVLGGVGSDLLADFCSGTAGASATIAVRRSPAESAITGWGDPCSVDSQRLRPDRPVSVRHYQDLQ